MGCGWNPVCYVADAAEDIGDALSDLTSDALDALEDLAATVEGAVGVVAESIVEIGESIYGAAGNVIGVVGSFVGWVVDVTGNSLYYVGDTLGHGIDCVKDAVVEAGTVIMGTALNFAGELIGWIIDGVVWLAEVVGEVAELAVAAVETVGQLAWDAVTLNDQIWNHLVKNFGEFAGSFLRLYETTLRGAFAMALNLYEMTIGRGLGLLAGVLDYIPLIGQYLGDFVRITNDFVGFVAVFVEILVALPTMLACQYTTWLQEDPDLENMIVQIVDPSSKLLSSGRVYRLPDVNSKVKYAIFSDHHKFVHGDTDFFTQNKAVSLYKSALTYLSLNGYHLIENGDVEDLWRRDSGNLGMRGSLGAGNRRTNLDLFNEIVHDNRGIYDLIEREFASKKRYARTVGNHDLPMCESYMQRELKCVAHPEAIVAEFLLIGEDTPTHLIAHGHQSDNFNRPGCEWFGETTTRLVSRWFQLPLVGDDMKGLSSSDPDLQALLSKGRENVLDEHPAPLFGYAQLDEPSIFKAYRRLIHKIALPWIVLGHSHDPKYLPAVQERELECSLTKVEPNPGVWGPQPPDIGGYVNTGTTGMMNEVIWFATIEMDSTGKIQTLLRTATFNSDRTSILLYTYGSKSPCGPEGFDQQRLLPIGGIPPVRIPMVT
jgi:hypothetical protein